MDTLLAIVLISIQGIGSPPQRPTPGTFSGTWVLDSARSVLYEGGKRELELVIVEEPASLTVTERRGNGHDNYAVAVDGKPHGHTIAGAVFLRTLRRANGMLLFQITMTRLSDQASISYTERWSLSDNGRTLTVYTTYPGGREVLKVFARKD